MKALSRGLPVLLGLFLLPCAVAQTQTLHSTSLYYTPVDFGALMMVFKLEDIEGNFIFATGSIRTTVTEAIVKRLKRETSSAVGSNGKPIIEEGRQARMVIAPSGQLGAFPIGQSHSLVMEPKKFDALFEQPVDGILGANFADEFATLIDFQKHTLTFYYGPPFAAEDLRKADMEDALVLPLVTPKVNYDGDFLVAARVRLNDAEEEDLVIDTGAATTMVSDTLAAKLKLKPSARGIKAVIYGKSIKVNKALISTVKLGNILLNNVTVQYPQFKGETNYQPHLGLDVLTKFRILLDIPHKKLYLKPIETPKPVK